jgi:3-methyl-2-oxobutanoate hydroxymethyltransferase
MLTCYDAAFARVLDAAGVDSLLVGDSLGMVLQGHSSTVSVSMDEMIYHTACVARANRTAWIIADMPFGSYQDSPTRAFAMRYDSCKPARKWSSSKAAGGLLRSSAARRKGHPRLRAPRLHTAVRARSRRLSCTRPRRGICEHLARAGSGARRRRRSIPAARDGPGGARARAHPGVSSAGDRHRRRHRMQRPGAGLARHARIDSRDPAALRAQLFMAGGATIQSAVGQYVKDVKEGRFPDDALHSF